ncbi:hypothetical protein RFI_05903 [Reticulomyxa filosa]|uniref:Uncharacterized protein n=1 Tax=Reticulomyxa filosa TaxID=46433 RepID=X6NZE6_RETFI|nr:hypothetical protein RFI_05903 [Reticulomyxa filosa]|eukprot:ETO31214.1 hypothetical protein RFI_05903 [Reticulomyxa filosa]
MAAMVGVKLEMIQSALCKKASENVMGDARYQRLLWYNLFGAISPPLRQLDQTHQIRKLPISLTIPRIDILSCVEKEMKFFGKLNRPIPSEEFYFFHLLRHSHVRAEPVIDWMKEILDLMEKHLSGAPGIMAKLFDKYKDGLKKLIDGLKNFELSMKVIGEMVRRTKSNENILNIVNAWIIDDIVQQIQTSNDVNIFCNTLQLFSTPSNALIFKILENPQLRSDNRLLHFYIDIMKACLFFFFFEIVMTNNINETKLYFVCVDKSPNPLPQFRSKIVSIFSIWLKKMGLYFVLIKLSNII